MDQLKIKEIFTALIASLFIFSSSFAEQKQNKEEDIFDRAVISKDRNAEADINIKFDKKAKPTVAEFFDAYRKKFSLSPDNRLEIFRQQVDELGQIHYRYKQHYKGLELFDTQFIVHEVGGRVKSANGRIIQGLNINTQPGLSEERALELALAHLDAKKYMWQDKKSEKLLKMAMVDKNATYYPKGKLGISSNGKSVSPEQFRLVYRFDIYATEPFSRYYVDVDARSGEIVNKISRLQTGTIAGFGESLYNGAVNMKVSDKKYIEAPSLVYFHVDAWNAYDTGSSWWVADPTLGDEGGYNNSWYQVLDTDPVMLSGSNPELSFYHRHAAEIPSPYPPFDAWDGMNVRISTDGGASWQVLPNPVPAYDNSSLYSFGSRHGEGPGIPGWTGILDTWTNVTVDLSAWVGQTVQIRFAFASDEAIATPDEPSWFGWQVDAIEISSSDGTLFSNSGSESGMTAKNLVKEVNIIPGDFRLRQNISGKGIFTYTMQNSWFYSDAIDFVSDSNKDWPDPVGVGVHWATEATYDYYKTNHNRTSYDDKGGRLVSYARAGVGFANAFWDGTVMTYGDGDGVQFGPLISLDVVGHELTHGVTEYSAGLIYQGESGALNESFSDIFGNMIEFFAEGYAEESWGCGEDFDLSGNGGFRSMSDPNAKGDPDTYEGNYWIDPYNFNYDNGGVHINSGVQNYWFYLLSQGGSGTNDNGDTYEVQGIGMQKAATIAYRNLTIYLTPSSAFYASRLGSIEAAEDLYGKNSKAVEAVKAAWDAVGVYEQQPLFKINDLIAFVQTLGLDQADEDLLTGLLTEAADLIMDGAFEEAIGNCREFQNAAISLYYAGAYDFNTLVSLYYAADAIANAIDVGGTPHDNRPKPQIQTLAQAPLEFALERNFPNPFNPVTTIRFSLPEASDIQLRIYNSTGQTVRTLADDNYQSGIHTVQWDGTNDKGIKVASGIYFYRINAGTFQDMKKMILLK